MDEPRLKEEMSFSSILNAMTERNPGAMDCISLLLKWNPNKTMNILSLLDRLGIYGENISLLWNQSCNCDMNRLLGTIYAFHLGKFSKEEIMKHLSECPCKPFV